MRKAVAATAAAGETILIAASVTLQRFSISGGQFGNHRKFFPGNKPKAAVILDFRPKYANHCRVPPAASVAAANIRVQF